MAEEKCLIPGTGYEVQSSMRIAGQEILLGINMDADNPYLVCTAESNDLLVSYTDAIAGDDYLEMLQEFIGRVNKNIDTVRAEREAINLPAALFTAAQCNMAQEQDLRGKVIAIKPQALSPEYRRGDQQLMLVSGGFGASAHARGRAVYGYRLSNGQTMRVNRNQVLGIVTDLPKWAKQRLSQIRQQIEKERKHKAKEREGR
jgi:hypothetical protein